MTRNRACSVSLRPCHGHGATVTNADGPVGLYFDGVNMPRARGLGQAMFDVDRVEILKGPQGTLYGRNTTGGTLDIISKKPSSAEGLSGFVQGTMGTYDYIEAGGVLNAPLSNTFATRFAVQRIKRDGFGRQILANRPDQDLDDENQVFARASALWDPTENIQVHLVGDWKKVDESARVLLHPAAVQNPNHPLYQALGVAAGLINSADPSTTLSFASFAPETATNYELGLKADWFANRLRTNLAVFYTDYEDVQRRRNIAAGFGMSAVVLTNAAKAHIPGFELDVEARPLDGVTLRASVGHVDPTYDEFFDINLTTLQLVGRSNEAFESVANWTYTIDGRYERELGGGVVGLSLNWSWQGEIDNYLVVTDPAIPRAAAVIEEYGLLNVRLDYRLEEVGWDFALWGRNVLDKEHLTRIQDTSTALGYLIAFPGTRALWGLEARKRLDLGTAGRSNGSEHS